MSRKMPYRPRNEISQQFNDGFVEIFSLTDTAKTGYQPKPELTKKEFLYFSEQRLGINRLYLSRQNNAEILRVLRVPRREISPRDIAKTCDGHYYRIDAVQSVSDVLPPCVDISLKAIEQKYRGFLK